MEKAGFLFKKYGVKSITMEDLSAELGVSKKTLYQLVSDKNKLINQVIKEDFINYQAKLKNILSSGYDPILQLIKIHHLTIYFLLEYSPVLEYDLKKYYNKVYQETRILFLELFQQAIIQNIEYGKEIEIYRNDINSEIISKLYISRIEQASKSKIVSLEEFVSEPYRKELLQFHFKGLVNDKGTFLLNKYINEYKSKKL